MQNLSEKIKAEIKKAIVGKDEIIDTVLMAILAGGHVLLEDVPGVGKTTLAVAFAKALGLDQRRIQFTSDTMPSDILGFSVYDKDKGNFVFKPGAVMTNLLLADEINRTSSKTQSALLEAMEEKNVTVDGQTYSLPNPFVVLATQNPVGSAGTLMLPKSQLDRFLIRLSMGYPDFDSQVNILRERRIENPLDNITCVITKEELTGLVKTVASVHVEEKVYEYVTELAQATRAHPFCSLGISPRGALAVCRMAKAHSFIHGYDFVSPEDILAIFPYVCAHRLMLNSKARLAEKNALDIISEVTKGVEIPKAARLA